MTNRKIVWQETQVIILGQLLCCGLLVGIYALLGRFSLPVVLSALAGGVLATLNFFVMALCADMAADKGQSRDVSGGQALIQLSYISRMALLFLILVLCAKSGLFDLVALVLPLVFVRPILTAAEFRNQKGGDPK